jgi:ATP dependent DNA ligase domain
MVKRTSTRFIARMIERAKPSQMPGFIAPQLAKLKSKAPVGDKWLHEIKYDGYRIQVHLSKGRVTIYTRGGHDWTRRFAVIAQSFDIPVERAIFDGEVVVIKEGRTNFSALQAELAAGRQRELQFYAFGLLFLEGFDLRRSEQTERKRVLKMLFDETARSTIARRCKRRRGVQACLQAELGRHHLEERRGALPLGSQRGLDQGQVRPAGEIPGGAGAFRQGSERHRRAPPGTMGRQGVEVRRQGRHRLESYDLGGNPPQAERGGDSGIEICKAGQDVEGDVGRAGLCCRGRIPGHLV